MAYLVSQLRKNGSQIYMTDVAVSSSTITSPNTFGGDNTFTDFALEGSFIPTEVYYLRFQIHKIPQYFYSGSKMASQIADYQDADELSLQILLKNGSDETDEITDPPEIIGTCSVPKAKFDQSESYSSYSFVFSPSKTFDHIGFRINRVSYDAINTSSPRNWLIQQEKIKNTDNKDIDSNTGKITISGERYYGIEETNKTIITTTGPRIKYGSEDGEGKIVTDGDICTLNNLITNENGPSGWLKFGYQSRPGSLIVVNGEPIRVGRSGIYEINNGTIINKFMIASPNGSDNKNIDAFLLDYAYKS